MMHDVERLWGIKAECQQNDREVDMDLESWSVDEIMDDLDALTEEGRVMLESRHLPIEELFPQKFMQDYTEFDSILELFDASGFHLESPEDFDQVPDDQWDAFIDSYTDFTDWGEMLQTAMEEWVEWQLEGK